MKKSKTLINSIFLAFFTAIKIILNFVIVKMIITNYGSEINGFNNTVLSILNYLNLMEAGVGAATIYSLYKPLMDNDRTKINGILSFTNKYFKKISIIMTLIMLIVAIFYPFTVKDFYNKGLGTYIIMIYALINISSYFYDSKYKLLYNADKKLYLSTISDIISYISSRIAFIIACVFKCNFFITISTLLIDMITRMLFTRFYNKKYYNWINLAEEPDKSIWKNSRNVFIQKIATLVFNSTDLLIITNILGAKQSSIYAVYNLVKNGLVSIMSILENSPIASLGQAFSKSENINHAKENYHIFEYICILLTTIFTCCWMILILPFIQIYTKNVNDILYINVGIAISLGMQFALTYYRMPQAVLANVTGMFQETKKIYLIEAIINFILSIFLVFKLGMVGVIIGSIIALIYSNVRITNVVYKKLLYEKKKGIYTKLILNLFFVMISSIIVFYNPLKIDSFIHLFFVGTVTCIIIIILVLIFNFIFYQEDMKKLINYIKGILSIKR